MSYDASPPDAFAQIIRNLSARIHAAEIRETSAPPATTVAALPTPSVAKHGRLRFVTNGRKVGELAGAGTGTLAYDDGVAWRRVADDTTVVA